MLGPLNVQHPSNIFVYTTLLNIWVDLIISLLTSFDFVIGYSRVQTSLRGIQDPDIATRDSSF